jgi:hypothetical protein
MDLQSLSQEERAQLLAELQAEDRAAKERVRQERDTYKSLKDESILKTFDVLQNVSRRIEAVKRQVFEDFETVISLKDEIFKTKSDRQTNTFTTEDGRVSVTLGNRVYEGWADTVNVGIGKVKNYLKTLARDENSANLVETVMGLLSKDRKGNLKASKVLELERLAKKTGDTEFLDGIGIIRDAYRPTPSCKFIQVKYRDDDGKEYSLPLSFSAFDNLKIGDEH